MLGVLSKTTNPAYNLATEEFLLKNIKEDVFFLYINEPCIVVGKHQNTLSEIDYSYTQRNNIPVYRRLSGGGTVYHDLGNLNFCFITNEKKGNLVNFDKHSAPIMKALETLGLTITLGKRHDLSIEGKKITGTASHVFKNRAMHHGTLLYSADLSVLNKCLNADVQKFNGKAVKSVRSAVTNISEYISQPVTMEEFTSFIFNSLQSYFTKVKAYNLSTKDNELITDLVKEKYSIWIWNYGYSPHYKFSSKIEINGKTIISELTVEKGIISNISFIIKEPVMQNILNNLATDIKGTQHNQNAILGCYNQTSNLHQYISSGQIINLLF